MASRHRSQKHPNPQTGVTDRTQVSKGAYVIKRSRRRDADCHGRRTLLRAQRLRTPRGAPWRTSPLRQFPLSAPPRGPTARVPRRRAATVGEVPCRGHQAVRAPTGWQQYADAGLNMRQFGTQFAGEIHLRAFRVRDRIDELEGGRVP